MRRPMKGLTSIIILLCFSLASFSQYGYDDEPYDEDENTSTDFGESHLQYLEEEIEITQFDREEYEKLIKLMVLKSRGMVVIDMDNIDPNFDPERYFQDNPGYGPGSGGGSGNGGYGGGGPWDENYSPGDGEYAEDWYEYYERDYDNYERYQKEDRRDIKKMEKEQAKPQTRKDEPSSGGFSVLLIILLALLLVLVIAFLFFGKDPEKKVSKENIEDLAPTEIPKSELELMLEKALANKDFRKAIRIYFIFMMKDLSEKGWIVWQKKKTNMLYLREMKGRPHYDQFKKVVSIYEVVWYGKREVSEADYKAVEPMLKQTLIDLSNHK